VDKVPEVTFFRTVDIDNVDFSRFSTKVIICLQWSRLVSVDIISYYCFSLMIYWMLMKIMLARC